MSAQQRAPELAENRAIAYVLAVAAEGADNQKMPHIANTFREAAARLLENPHYIRGQS